MTTTKAHIDGGHVVNLLVCDDDAFELPGLDLVPIGNAAPAIGWSYAAGRFAPPPQPEPTLADLQARLDAARVQAWDRIKAARTAAETAPLTVAGRTYDADPASRERLMGAVLLASLAIGAGQGAGWSITWTLADNSSATLCAPELIAVGATLGQRIAAAFDTGRQLRERVDVARTIDELTAIAWPTKEVQ